MDSLTSRIPNCSVWNLTQSLSFKKRLILSSRTMLSSFGRYSFSLVTSKPGESWRSALKVIHSYWFMAAALIRWHYQQQLVFISRHETSLNRHLVLWLQWEHPPTTSPELSWRPYLSDLITYYVWGSSCRVWERLMQWLSFFGRCVAPPFYRFL